MAKSSPFVEFTISEGEASGALLFHGLAIALFVGAIEKPTEEMVRGVFHCLRPYNT